MDAYQIQAALIADPTRARYATRNRLGGSMVAALGRWLHTLSEGTCGLCGQPTDLGALPTASNRAEVCHLLPASAYGDARERCGYVPGNVFSGCRACNEATADSVISPAMLTDESVCPTAWPSPGELKASYPAPSKGTDAYAAEARARRAARGLPF